MQTVIEQNNPAEDTKLHDFAHEGLFRIIDDMLMAASCVMSRESLEGMLIRLSSYTAGYFRQQEVHMQRCNYQGYLEHKAWHDVFLFKLSSLRQNVRDGRAVDGAGIMTFVKSWLVNHGEGPDQHFRECLNLKPRLQAQTQIEAQS